MDSVISAIITELSRVFCTNTVIYYFPVQTLPNLTFPTQILKLTTMRAVFDSK